MSDAWRATLTMCVIYSGIGLSLPFLPVWLREVRNLDGWEIGAILSGAQLARLFTGAGLAAWGEGRTVRRAVRAFMAVTLAAWLVFAAVNDLAVMVITGFIASSAAMAANPFIELATMRATRSGSLSFGVARSLGSAAFMVTNVAAGWAVAMLGPEIVMPWLLVNACLALAASQFLPRGVQPPRTSLRSRLIGMGRLFHNRAFVRIALATSLVQASHAFYYGFSTNIWRIQGFPDTTIGLLWAFAVVVEIVFLTNSGQILRRFGMERVLLAGAVLGMVRWTTLAFQPGLVAVFLLQILHTGTFAMTYIATLRLIERDLPEENHAAAISLAASLGGGTLLGIAMFGSGVLFDTVGALGYLAMAGLCLAGLISWLGLKQRQA